MHYLRVLLPSVFMLCGLTSSSQKKTIYSRQDSLRGSMGMGRKKWDVRHYNITVEPDIRNKTLKGSNIISFMDSGVTRMQIDLQSPMQLDSIVFENKKCSFIREENVFWINLPKSSKSNISKKNIALYFHGRPREAIRAPWDGGWVWKKDAKQNPFISVACQGLGASVWYPCKDTQSDEPDEGCDLNIIVPENLVAIGNGRLIKNEKLPGNKTLYSWRVTNPINNYNIVPYIGNYKHFSETYNGLKGPLTMDYWVLEQNLEKAKTQFEDAKKMMQAFEYWMGPYPFYEDGFKLVEAPYLGMEHQSNIAYGNEYVKGYEGYDRSGTGWGLLWDYIIVHESGHEWFANNITTNDIADMWVHEGFTTYTETLFTEYYFGKEAGNEYTRGLRGNIYNDSKIIGAYGVNNEGSSDMYDKGSNMIHTIRQVIDNDSLFREILKGLNKQFYHRTVNTEDVEQYISKLSGKDLSSIFNQYLRTTAIPTLEYYIENNQFHYRWRNTVSNLLLPVKIKFSDAQPFQWITPSANWEKMNNMNSSKVSTPIIDPNFYINSIEKQPY